MVVIYTDGGFRADKGGGWAWVAVDLDEARVLNEGSGIIRRGQMPHYVRGAYYAECFAIAKALESMHAEGATIRTDVLQLQRTLNDFVRGRLQRPLLPIEQRVSELLHAKRARLEQWNRQQDQWAERADRLANRRQKNNPHKWRRRKSKSRHYSR
ncbi:MAG: hypothetical protein OXC08_20640 [Thiotrichales bacterium]|nr:hypothetical protein [Thiotrichales bacterium]